MTEEASPHHRHPPKLSHAKLSTVQKTLIDNAKKLYQERLAYFAQTHQPPAYVGCAPGRVNLIGEHVDYQNGFVLPFCLEEYNVVVYGTGFLHTGKSNGNTMVRIRLCSDQADVPEMIEERRLSGTVRPPDISEGKSWVNYVVGVIVQYMPDIPSEGCVLDLAMAYSSNLPLGAGLSSSAALEVATASFIECFLHDDMAFSSEQKDNYSDAQIRALRCQTAENTWAYSPCGIMDQMVVSCGKRNHVLLLDCASLETTHIVVKQNEDDPVCFLLCNSKVTHSIANGEYGKRRKECQEAVEACQRVPLYHVESLRDATIADIDQALAKNKMDDTLYQRAHHVISENLRTKQCAQALKLGLFEKVGELMNASHASLSNDYKVSCEELDILQQIAVEQEGVYGSRMTGGGFGGCTITLCKEQTVKDVMEALVTNYKEQTGKTCECFVAHAGAGASVLAMDVDCMPESDFYKS